MRQPHRSASSRQAQVPMTKADTQACMRRKWGPSAATTPAMVQARRLKLSSRSGDIGGRRLEARDGGEATAALRIAGFGGEFQARQAQAECHPAAAPIHDPP